ncbi:MULTISPECIES: alpha/beta hydrolase [unclassified Streptomyces]|uniref:alpha/beta hydrolase n=1 Tax=unclassified Streptomyces TaxID=2593676 RepID=UPI002E17728D
MRAAPALCATAGSLILSALVTAPAGAAVPTPPPAAETAGTTIAALRAADAGIHWGACPEAEGLPDSVRCGTVTVPLDYAHPMGKKIKLTVSRVKATGKNTGKGAGKDKGRKVARQGPLVFNPGGPGGNGMYFPVAGTQPEWRPIAAAYDLVGYAPRGVGRSAPLSCEDPKKYRKGPTQSPTHPSAAYKKKRVAQAKAYAHGCAERNPDIEHFNTLNNARDLDVLRAALGEKKLTFLGASYGTYLGAVYAELFPSHVRRMVFDSAVDPSPDGIWYANNLEQSAAFERRWTDFKAWVAHHDKTYHLGSTPGKVQAAYEKVSAEVSRKPAGGKVGPAQLQSAFLQAGYYDDYWPLRAYALSAYVKGDPKPLVDQAAPIKESAKEDENSNAVYTAVQCNDASWPTDFRTWDRDNSALAKRAPFETWDNAWMNLPCAYWSTPRQQPLDVRTSPGELPPTLILAAERDAATPYKGAQELNRRLAGSSLVTERKAGTHGIGAGPNQCVNGRLDAYLLDGELPEKGSASCAPHKEPKPLGS